MDTIIMNWSGPFYDREDTKYYDLNNGIYAFFSTKKYSRDGNIVLEYIGKTEINMYDRMYNHHVWYELNDTKLLWFGTIINKRIFNLELIEHNFIYFCEPILNKKKIFSKPNESTIIISEFLKKNGERYVKQPNYLEYIPELIYWDNKNKILKKSNRLELVDYNI